MRAPLDVCSAPPDGAARLHGPGLRAVTSTHEPGRRSVTMKFSDVTPNLVVSDIEKSQAFYRDVLGFSAIATVPDGAPFVFVWMRRDGVNVFLNTVASITDDQPALAARPIGGTATMYMAIEADSAAEGVDALFETVKAHAKVIMPLHTQFYGMREFGVEDPDGYVIYVAQRVG
jgi:uncharacterized glyoxalase superfamily protein PhnB